MPQAVYAHMQLKIRHGIDMLEGRKDLPYWLAIPQSYSVPIADVLRTWQRDPEGITAEVVQDIVTNDLGPQSGAAEGSESKLSAGIQKEFEFYKRSLALFPEPGWCKTNEATLYDLIDKVYTKPKARKQVSKDIKSLVASTWKINPTYFDLDDKHNPLPKPSDVRPAVEDFASEFFNFTGIDPPETQLHIYFYAEAFFRSVAKALRKVSKHMAVEISVCDVVQYLEELRWSKGQELGIPSSEQIHRFQGFDRLHLSNIPDYVGGSMFLHLFVAPVTKAHKEAFATTNCLRNPQQWPRLTEYDSEYLTLSEPKFVQRAFAIIYRGDWELEDKSIAMPCSATSMFGLPMINYQKWAPLPHFTRAYDKLLNKVQLTQWLQGLFFKIALPAPQSCQFTMKIFTSLNFSIFLRLLVHLHTLGYPSHSLAAVLTDIITNRVVTRVRPPQRSPLRSEELQSWQSNTAQKLSTAPFVAGMSTLTSIFLTVLPFPLLVSDKIVPPQNRVRRCTLHFSKQALMPTGFNREGDLDTNRPEFFLMFTKILDPPVHRMRELLLDNKYLDRSPDDVHVITVWEWDQNTKKASFWLREDVIEVMKGQRDKWQAAIWRTDTWQPANPHVPFQSELRIEVGQRWTEVDVK